MMMINFFDMFPKPVDFGEVVHFIFRIMGEKKFVKFWEVIQSSIDSTVDSLALAIFTFSGPVS